MLRTTSQPMLFRRSPILLLKTSYFFGPSLPCQPPAWGHPIAKNPRLDEVTGQQEGPFLHRWGSKWVFLPLSCLQSLFCLCSSSGLNSGHPILCYILTAASLTNLADKGPVIIHSSASFIEVTHFFVLPGLWRAWFLFFSGICTAGSPLSAFLFAVFLGSVHWHTW